jgi:predicted SnoaL-like aldol condensation-catalyzing enzyme
MATEQDMNKEKVKRLLDAAFNQKKPEVAASYVTERYIQHNPQVPTGKAGLVETLPMFYSAIPTLSWKMIHIWAEGDFVIVHSLYNFGRDTAVVDIFRFEGEMIDEHWDVVQEIPQKMAHGNGMF